MRVACSWRKVLFVKNNTAAQHKHCKSLSPEQKGQVLTIDAAAHKKQYELLPSKRKATLMETRAGQCHEHLTDEEKKFRTDKVCCCYSLWKSWSW
jgi:hypothetical protein